jgi:hypothetical protein
MTHASIYQPSPLQRWLNEPKALLVLRAAAQGVLRWAKDDPQLRDSLGWDREDPEAGVVAYMIDLLFDQDRKKARCRHRLACFLDDGDMKGFRSTLISAVINHCRDERRKEGGSAFHFNYRRVRETLYKAGVARGVRCVRIGDGTFYSLDDPGDLPVQEAGVLGTDGFRGWPAPAHPYSTLGNAEVQLEISRLFWDQALQELGTKHFLALFDLVSYLGNCYGFFPPIRQERSGSEGEHTAPSETERLHSWQPHDQLGTLGRQWPVAEERLLHADLEDAARRLALSWSRNMRAGLYFNIVLGLTLKETAARLKLDSPQAVGYHVSKAQNALKEFFRQWRIDGYEGERPSRDEQKVVLSTLIDFILKNELCCRDEL